MSVINLCEPRGARSWLGRAAQKYQRGPKDNFCKISLYIKGSQLNYKNEVPIL